ncbi:hypothetical protein ACFVAJ_17490 [Agromyces sp. NPDC057679]|uniref:hypothetical protein n=1 Tax=Agromyces sp. NPDC057679 TaxID=3346207 RepID=UPI00366D37F2
MPAHDQVDKTDLKGPDMPPYCETHERFHTWEECDFIKRGEAASSKLKSRNELVEQITRRAYAAAHSTDPESVNLTDIGFEETRAVIDDLVGRKLTENEKNLARIHDSRRK